MDDVDLLSEGNEDEDDDIVNVSPLTSSGSPVSDIIIIPASSSNLNSLVLAASAAAGLGGLLFGYDIGIISGAGLQLRRDFNFDDTHIEYIVTALLCGSLIASICGGIIVDKVGRRLTILINTFIFIAGAFILALAHSFHLLIIGRLVVGFAVSLSAVAECIYISEIAPSNKRGLLVSINELGIAVGILLAYLVNFLLIRFQHGWRYMFGLSSVPALLQALAMVFLPSSPRWLMSKGKEEEAKHVAQRLWPGTNIRHEVAKMKLSLAANKRYSFLDLFSSTDKLRRRMAIGCGLVFFQQITGQPTMLYYAPHLFKSLGFHSNVSATFATFGLGVVKVICTGVTLLSVDKCGRRTLLLIGSALMTVAVVAMCITTEPLPSPTALAHQLQNISCLSPNATLNDSISLAVSTSISPNCTAATDIFRYPGIIKYTCLISLMVFVSGYAVGYGPVSWLLLSEIFPVGIRGRAVSIATVFNYGTNIFISLTYLDVMDAIGPSYMFLGYALIGLLSLLFIYHFIPETKQKSLEQISQDMNSRTVSCTVPLCCRPKRGAIRVCLNHDRGDEEFLIDSVEDQL